MYLLRCLSFFSNTESVKHFFTPQIVTLCDDNVIPLRSTSYFMLHFATSFVQQSSRDLTLGQVFVR